MRPTWSAILWLALCWPAVAAAGEADLESALAGVDLEGIGLVEAWEAEDGILHVVFDELAAGLAGHDGRREDLIRDLLWAGRALRPGLAGVQAWIALPDGRRELLSDHLRDPTEARLIRALVAGRPKTPRNLPPTDLPYGGSLTGKTIALSPGHGWTWSSNLGAWAFQRGLINLPGCASCLGIIEDRSNAQIAARYLIPHLLRAGARVWSARERDLGSAEVIVDDADAGYAEQGAWTDGNSEGGQAGDYRVLLAADGGQASFALEPQTEGTYWVSLWQVAGDNRVTDAQVTVEHLGGQASFHLDQTRDGSRWIHLGAWRFAPGGGGRVTISPGPAAEPERYLIADAVRLGGGRDQQVVSGQAADRDRWEMGALYGLPYLGLPAAINTGSDVTIRPAWAEWQGADAYLSLHSNASGGGTDSASGTSTYRYNCGSYPDHSADPDPADCDDPPGSDRLQAQVHSAMIEFLRAEWDPAWRDRGTLVANFGEMRVLDGIPGALVESAFHDGTQAASAEMRMSDNQALQDPRFRYWLGYAMYAGLARFFDPDVQLLPARAPTGVHLVHAPGGGMLVSWEPVAQAGGYRVRWAVDGWGLGPGLTTEATAVVLDDFSPGQTVAVRVSALNAGGEGPPSQWLAARYRGNGALADALVVTGFDRQDAYIGDGRNRRDQALAHAAAIAAIPDHNYYADCAANEALISGAVDPTAYRAVVWILGEESTEHETFDESEQDLVRALRSAGVGLLATGAEVGWDLVERGGVGDQIFFSDAFDAIYLADDAESTAASGVGAFAGVGPLAFDGGSHGIYPVEWPDVLEAESDLAEVVLTYDTGEGAAVASTADGARSILVGFPLETLVSADQRSALMQAALAFLLPEHTPDDYDSDGLPDAWEHEHETDPLTPSADDDPDGDGKTNAEEYADGTDPQVADGQPDGGQDDGGQDDGGPDTSAKGGGCGCGPGAGAAPLSWLLLLAALGRRRKD